MSDATMEEASKIAWKDSRKIPSDAKQGLLSKLGSHCITKYNLHSDDQQMQQHQYPHQPHHFLTFQAPASVNVGYECFCNSEAYTRPFNGQLVKSYVSERNSHT